MKSLTSVEARLALREPVNLIVSLAFPLMLLVVLLAVFGNQPDETFGGVGGTDFYVPAYVAAVIAAYGLIALPVHLASYEEDGVLDRLRASGVGVRAVLTSQFAVAVAVVTIGAALMLGVGFAAYELSSPDDILGVVVGFVIGTLAFCAVGVGLAAVLPGARAAQSVGLFLFFGMFFIAGGGPPRALLPDWLGTVGDWLPMSYLVRVMRSPWKGDGWDWVALAVLGVFLAGGVVASTRLARVER